MYLIYTFYGNVERAADSKILLGVQHLFQFIHSIVYNEFLVVNSFEEVQSAIADYEPGKDSSSFFSCCDAGLLNCLLIRKIYKLTQ